MADRNIATVDLDRAVEAGVIDRETADSLVAFASAGATPPAGGERFRIISTFADVFLAVGLTMLTGGLVARANWWSPYPLIEALVFAAVTWGLAEYVVRRKRMVLPGMVLAVAFAVLLGSAASKAGLFNWLQVGWMGGTRESAQAALAGGLAAIGGGLFFLRFRFPFSLFVVVGGLAVMALSGVAAARIFPGADITRWVALGCGMLAFIAAIACDTRDPRRERLVADCGFWLHVAAAPLIAHAIFAEHMGFYSLQPAAWLTSAGLLLLTLVSLVIDRRALIVSALTYAGGLILYAMRDQTNVEHAMIVALAVLGTVVVLLGFAWVSLRRLLLRILPLGPLARRLPPAVQTA